MLSYIKIAQNILKSHGILFVVNNMRDVCGGFIMINDLNKENVTKNIQVLINQADKWEPDTSLYVRFMRDQILHVNTNN